MASELLLFFVGLALILAGGDRLLNAAVSLSRRIGIPQIVVGATIVSFCTTLPEMMVSTTAIFDGSAAITVGNAIGSIICNTGLIAGISLAFSPSVQMNISELTWRCLFFLCVMLGMMAVAAFFGGYNTPVGLCLLALFAVYAALSIYFTQKESTGQRGEKRSEEPGDSEPSGSLARDLLVIAVSAAFLFVGARLLVTHGIELARLFGIPERAIAVTAIALGTSLPELVTTILSVVKHCSGVGIGNVIGANIFNILLVIGIPSAFAAVPVSSDTLLIDMPLALVTMVILTLPILIRGKTSRLQGVLLIGIYAAYCVLVL